MEDEQLVEIAQRYGMTLDEYKTMRQKIVDLNRRITADENIEQAVVYNEIEKVSVSTKEAIMITSALQAINMGRL
jgi:hypothetical protein